MKKLLFNSLLLLFAVQLLAQTNPNTDKSFTNAMATNLAILDTASSASDLLMLANNFDRIATTAKTYWQPYYYAAYCYAVMALNSTENDKIDLLADKADQGLQQAAQLQKNNSEISVVFAFIKAARLSADPMNRWQTLITQIEEHLATAKLEDPSNPRPYLVEAKIKYKMPEQLGGGKDISKKLLQQAVEKFNTFTPKDSLAPHWGQQSAEKLLAALNTAG